VLADDGTLWLNLGDSYANDDKWGGSTGGKHVASLHGKTGIGSGKKTTGLAPKNLIGIPWRVAFALQDDGWVLRQDIIWCLSGGTWVYVRTQKGDMPMMLRDVARLNPATVQLWNGEKWTQLLGMNKSSRQGTELEIVLRSGERISCTPTHKFPTKRGLLDASDLIVGDVMQTCRLPEPDHRKDCAIDDDAAWLAGLYIAEGSRSNTTIQIAGHVKESERWERVQQIAAKFGGSATRTIDGNQQNIRLYGRVLHALLDELVTGHTAKDKAFAPVVWRYSNRFLASMLDGYLAGDGHFDPANNRWRLGFTRNYNLERDLRTACARLGYRLTLNMSTTKYDEKEVPTFRGEIRMTRSGHRNEADMGEIMEIRKARCRYVYDLGVADDPHVFALASGVLTHNSKPNPMPESVTDRCTKAHEYIFLFAKQTRYSYDHEAVKEASVQPERAGKLEQSFSTSDAHSSLRQDVGRAVMRTDTRNRRSVWTIATQPYAGAHFAVMPPALVAPCILAGCPEGGTVLDPFVGSGTVVAEAVRRNRHGIGIDLNPDYLTLARERIEHAVQPLWELL
jgi:hypothetical protein